MSAFPEGLESRALAAAWLWSRPSFAEVCDPVDLEVLDQWRQGLLSPQRSAHVKRQLANDPRLMRLLEELVAADAMLAQQHADEAPAASRPGIWARLSRVARHASARVSDPLWAGGLAVAASLLLALTLLPMSTTPDLGQQLDAQYAALDRPREEMALPWGPRIALRNGSGQGSETAADVSGRVARYAFQAGMIAGIEQLNIRHPELHWNPGVRLDAEPQNCALADETCRQWRELAHTTGRWALVAYLQCRGSSASHPSPAFDLLPALQVAWGKLPAAHPLGDDVQAIRRDQDACREVASILRTWGR